MEKVLNHYSLPGHCISTKEMNSIRIHFCTRLFLQKLNQIFCVFFVAKLSTGHRPEKVYTILESPLDLGPYLSLETDSGRDFIKRNKDSHDHSNF